jgi:hypothetical protein
MLFKTGQLLFDTFHFNTIKTCIYLLALYVFYNIHIESFTFRGSLAIEKIRFPILKLKGFEKATTKL